MKKNTFLFILIIIFLINFDLKAYKDDFVTVSDIVKKVKNRFNGLDSYQANFLINSEKMGKKKKQKGVIKYKAPDKFLLEFHNPYGQKIVAHKDKMWIYIPSMNVVAEQNLDEKSGLLVSGGSAGLNRLFSQFHYRFASKEQPEKQKDGSKKYTLLLKQRESKNGYREIKLWISEDFFIVKAQGKTSSRKDVEISFSNINTQKTFNNGLFTFDLPSKARVIKNPMILEE